MFRSGGAQLFFRGGFTEVSGQLRYSGGLLVSAKRFDAEAVHAFMR